MNISEGLFLLLITDKGGDEPWIMAHNQALAAGVIADLALGGHITLTDDKKPEIHIVENAPAPTHAALVAGLAQLKEKAPVRVDKTLNSTWFKVRNEIGNELAKKGIVRVDTSSFLFFSSVKHPTINGESEEKLRQRLVGILRGNIQPVASDAVLLTILKSIDAVRPLLKKDIEAAGGRTRRKDINDRIDSLPQKVTGLSEQLRKVFHNLYVAMYVMPGVVIASGATASS